MTNKPEMTFEIARDIAMDAANRRMRKAGRKVWNEDDYNLASRTLDRLIADGMRFETERETE